MLLRLIRWWRSDAYKAEVAADKIQSAYERHYDGKISDAQLAQVIAANADRAQGALRARKT